VAVKAIVRIDYGPPESLQLLESAKVRTRERPGAGTGARSLGQRAGLAAVHPAHGPAAADRRLEGLRPAHHRLGLLGHHQPAGRRIGVLATNTSFFVSPPHATTVSMAEPLALSASMMWRVPRAIAWIVAR
jgi:hypothetical protein